ncbi:MAG TPA: pentapeptide repeat-containing protein [Caulobacteraceae bacterium]|nr:pentapeptide repeat-containing protein [Caulobacteraceae bacterium]
MKSLLALAAALAVTAAQPALAQNAGQIARAKDGASCPGCNLFQADFSNAELKSKNFARARLRQADLSASVMNRTSFAGGDLRDVNAYGAVFTGANFAGADLTNATFVGTYLEGANLRGARLSGANFSGAEMERALGLTQAQLAQACGDDSTKLPRGLRIRFC